MRLQGNRGEAYCSRRPPLAKADIDHPSAAEHLPATDHPCQ